MTVTELLRLARQTLDDGAGMETDAGILLGHVLGLGAAQLIAQDDNMVTEECRTRFLALVQRRLSGEPVSYLTGAREFWSLPFYVDSRVLVPRHETETLVECCLSALCGFPDPAILELGTGCGVVALSLSMELPDASIVATDSSEPALDVARINRRSLGADSLQLIQSNWFERVGNRKFHLVCSNPPYIAEGDPHLESSSLGFEPAEALVSGAEGLDDLSIIVNGAGQYLLEGGSLVVEHGFEQGAQVRHLFADACYQDIETSNDLNGNERVTRGRYVG